MRCSALTAFAEASPCRSGPSLGQAAQHLFPNPLSTPKTELYAILCFHELQTAGRDVVSGGRFCLIQYHSVFSHIHSMPFGTYYYPFMPCMGIQRGCQCLFNPEYHNGFTPSKPRDTTNLDQLHVVGPEVCSRIRRVLSESRPK